MKNQDDSSAPPENLLPFETAEGAKLRIEQARRLKPLVKEHGLHFEVFLPTTLGTWVLEMVEKGRFVDPSEAVFVLMGLARDLDPHQDLKEEIMKRKIDERIKRFEPGQGISLEELKERIEERKKEAREISEPVVWKKIPLE